uniref:uncharacterized protein LOC130483444 n=1 Tax=Euleptes europaea TaxID=460621 RepID=UPI002541897C|nr:uncharacterized protein LOC130483444 [Euleptes europaea]
MRPAVPVEKRVAASIWYLANANTYREVEQQFGLGLSTVGKMVLEFCIALEIKLYRKTVCIGQDINKIMAGFAELGMPHCVGAIDGCHIPINNPKGVVEEYGNRKNFSSMLLQGTVDHSGRFIDAETGWAGRNNDAGVFTQSNLCRAMDSGCFVPGNPVITLDGVSVPALMIADGAYPMRRWLMTPIRNPAGARERNFCYRLSRARNVVERAFGRLKSRWRCLSERLKVSTSHAVSVIVACVILHNICEARGHSVWPAEEPCVVIHTQEDEDYNPHEERNLPEGRDVREVLVDFMWRNRRGA